MKELLLQKPEKCSRCEVEMPKGYTAFIDLDGALICNECSEQEERENPEWLNDK